MVAVVLKNETAVDNLSKEEQRFQLWYIRYTKRNGKFFVSILQCRFKVWKTCQNRPRFIRDSIQISSNERVCILLQLLLFFLFCFTSCIITRTISSATRYNYLYSYMIILIENELVGKNLLFAIFIPLLENNEYSLFELLPYPFSLHYPSLTYHTILPINRYLIHY